MSFETRGVGKRMLKNKVLLQIVSSKKTPVLTLEKTILNKMQMTIGLNIWC